MELKNKVAIITGAAQGIGKAIAEEFKKHGALVVRTDIKEIKEENFWIMDIVDRNGVKNVFTEIKNKYSRIDILVNNAAISFQKPFETITDYDWEKMLKINLQGAFICSQEAIPYMKDRGGRIINISSIGGQWGGNLAVHYSAAKAGIISLTRSLARIYSKDNILTNCIAPGLVCTEMSKKELETEAGKEKIKSIPIGRVADPEEIAKIAVFLASEYSSYITGQTINANGGMFFNS